MQCWLLMCFGLYNYIYIYIYIYTRVCVFWYFSCCIYLKKMILSSLSMMYNVYLLIEMILLPLPSFTWSMSEYVLVPLLMRLYFVFKATLKKFVNL